MGILNVTPDSFSDGGAHHLKDNACARAMQMADEGADIIDIGAESTRPGAQRLSEDEELKRLVPLLRKLAGRLAVRRRCPESRGCETGWMLMCRSRSGLRSMACRRRLPHHQHIDAASRRWTT